MNGQTTSLRVLVADDEPDVLAVTRLSLRGISHKGRTVELAHVESGDATIRDLRDHPETAVLLLDVVMERNTAGLDACRAIREQLANRFVRILLRTGQPGSAPERTVIDTYDIDGYLLKSELSSSRLYSAVRTALKAHVELVDLERHRGLLKLIHETSAGLRSYEPLDVVLRQIVSAATRLSHAPLAVIHVQTVHACEPREIALHAGDSVAASAIRARISADSRCRDAVEPIGFGDGYWVPIVLHRGLGRGWLFLAGAELDDTVRQVLPILAAHAANALYAAVAQDLLEGREGPFFQEMLI